MSRRDDPFLPLPPPAPGLAKNVHLPQRTSTWNQSPLHAMLTMLCFPVVAGIAGTRTVWAVTSERGDAQGHWVGAIARGSWFAVWLGLAAVVASFRPEALVGWSLAMAVFTGMFSRHLALLTRPNSGRSTALNLQGALLSALFVFMALSVGGLWVAGLAPLPVMVFGIPLTLIAVVLALVQLFWWVAAFWTPEDRVADQALSRTRLFGVMATWKPWGYLWHGAHNGVPWRVIADSTLLPAAVRVEVALPGFPALRVRKRRPGDQAGAPLSDPILASTLVVGGLDEVALGLLLDEGHELVLPLVHGQGAVIEYGVLRQDLAHRPPLGQPWTWIEPVLHEAVAVAARFEERRLQEAPRTDEVIRELEVLSRQEEEPS